MRYFIRPLLGTLSSTSYDISCTKALALLSAEACSRLSVKERLFTIQTCELLPSVAVGDASLLLWCHFFGLPFSLQAGSVTEGTEPLSVGYLPRARML